MSGLSPAPYKRTPPRHDVGVVLPDGRVMTEDGTRIRFADLPPNKTANQREGLRIFGDLNLVMGRHAGRGVGRVDLFNRSHVAWWPDPDHRVILQRDEPGWGPEVLAGLVAFRDFLHERGASIGSNGSSSWSLLRATLTSPIAVGVGVSGPKAIIPDNMGGRNESFADVGRYPAFQHVDLRAAYPSTLGTMTYPSTGEWAELRRPRFPDWDLPMIARARVRVPVGDVAPLPRRLTARTLNDYSVRDWPTSVTMTGTYERTELEAAELAGAHVELLRVWVRDRAGVDRPFEPWWREVQQARELPGYAGDLGKLAGAVLWGRFLAPKGDLVRVRYVDNRIVEREPIRTGVPDLRWVGYDVAELVTARVRARLLRELILPTYAENKLIGVHTDGGLVLDDGKPLNLGPDWRVKYGGLLEYLTPAAFRYRTADASRWTYVMGGIPTGGEREAFEDKWRYFRGVRLQGNALAMKVEGPGADEAARRMMAATA